MDNAGSRPDWVVDPPLVNFQTLNKPLMRVCDNMLQVLERLSRTSPGPHGFRPLLLHLL